MVCHKNMYRELNRLATEKREAYVSYPSPTTWAEYEKAETVVGEYAVEYNEEIFGKEMTCLDLS